MYESARYRARRAPLGEAAILARFAQRAALVPREPQSSENDAAVVT